MNRGIIQLMLLARRILILLRWYLHDDETRDKYAGTFEYYGKQTNKAAFVAWLRHERHLRLSVSERFRLEYHALASRFSILPHPSGKIVKVRRGFKLWHEKIYDAIDLCEKRGYVKIDSMSREKIELLPAGRRFTQILPFINEVAREFGPLKSMLTGTGIGAGIGTIGVLIYNHWPW